MFARSALQHDGRRAAIGILVLTVAAIVVNAPIARGSASDDLEQAVVLYHSARFDDALSALDRLERGEESGALSAAQKESASEVRALCLIALQREGEAKTVVEGMLERRIGYQPRAEDVPPRFVSIVRESRTEVWQRLVREEYRAGKASYDQKAYGAAQEHLRNVLRLMGEKAIEPDVRQSVADVADLAKGFLALAMAADAVPSLPPATSADARAPTSAAARAPAPTPAPAPIYSSADAGIAPPTTIEQALPPWRNTGTEEPFLRGRQGVLEIVVDTKGRVESARLSTPVHPLYDRLVLAAARTWRYRPATKDGAPVRYRKVIDIHLVDP